MEERRRAEGKYEENIDAHALASLYFLSAMLCNNNKKNKKRAQRGLSEKAERKDGEAEERGEKS